MAARFGGMADLSDRHEELLARPDMRERIKPGGFTVAPGPDADDPVRLACLAMRTAGVWGRPAFGAEPGHPLFAEAVSAAGRAAGERQAHAAALAVFTGAPA